VKLRHFFLVVTLLFSTLLFAQTASTPQKHSSPMPAATGNFPVMSAAAKTRAKQLFGYFESGQSGSLFAAMSPQMKKQGSAASLANTAKQLATQLGQEQKVLGENFAPDLLTKSTVYARYSQFAKSKDPVFTVLTVDEHGQVSTLQFRPAPPPTGSRYVDYKDKTKLNLPFTGEWFVYQGGRDIYQNNNAYRDADRYSTVFTVLKDGQTFSGDGTKNEQFFCYGQPVASPADGTIVLIKDSFADNLPGRPEDTMPGGNRVLISHGNGEYSLFLHLKQNSIKVKSGVKVKQGDVVGECGNSGNSPAPHVEYRLQNSRGLPLPMSLPAQFIDYIADGKPVASGEPVRGEFVRNSTDTAASTAEKK
jgi:hypothetical protein